jgi:hypothetical protein
MNRILLGCLLGLNLITTAAFAANDNCPGINAIHNSVVPDASLVVLNASSTTDSGTGTVTFIFSGNDPNNPYTGGYGQGATGVPGLITYCVFPEAPDNGISAIAVGADGTAFQAKVAKGGFSYTRGNGNPTNVPLDNTTYTMGTATWTSACQTVTLPDGTTQQICGVPPNFTILLHINDASVCSALYGGTSSTCFVYPNNGSSQPPPPACSGQPACKSATITDASGNDVTLGVKPACVVSGNPSEPCPIVPMNTQLFVNYAYEIVNQPANTFTMDFLPQTVSTKDINTGGGKDYYGCEQIPNPTGNPGNWSAVANYEATPFTFNFTQGNGACAQSRFFAYVPKGGTKYSLSPGSSIIFDVNMVTRKNKSGNFEYTSCGSHLLNSGFTVKWLQSNDTPADSVLHSFTTGITPLYVYAVDPNNPTGCTNP